MYTGFGTIHGFKHPLGVLECIPPEERGLSRDGSSSVFAQNEEIRNLDLHGF